MIGNLLLALLFIFIRISFFLGGWGTELLRTKNFAGRNRVHLYCSTSCGAGSYDIGGKRRFWAWLLHNFLEKKKKKQPKWSESERISSSFVSKIHAFFCFRTPRPWERPFDGVRPVPRERWRRFCVRLKSFSERREFSFNPKSSEMAHFCLARFSRCVPTNRPHAGFFHQGPSFILLQDHFFFGRIMS